MDEIDNKLPPDAKSSNQSTLWLQQNKEKGTKFTT